MARSRNQDGTWRRKRGDTLMENLPEHLPDRHPPRQKLGNARKREGVDSLDQLIKKEREGQ